MHVEMFIDARSAKEEVFNYSKMSRDSGQMKQLLFLLKNLQLDYTNNVSI